MAVRKLYLLVAISFTSQGKVSDVIRGFTVARSDDEVSEIVRRHVGPRKRFYIYHLSTGGPKPPAEVRSTVGSFLEWDFDWLDPRGRTHVHGARNVPLIVEQLMTEGHAL